MKEDQSPAPVAGAVEALFDAIKDAIRKHRLTNWTREDDEGMSFPLVELLTPPGDKSIQRGADEIDYLVDEIYSDEAVSNALAALAKPAPAVAVEAERELFEAYFAASRRNKGVAKRPTFHQLEDGTYSDDHTQRHWWTWQNALAARSAPAVAEKVPLTPEQANNVWRRWVAAGHVQCDWLSLLRLTEAAHGIGSGSAQEGQAK